MRNLVVVVIDTLRRLDTIRQLNLERDAPMLSRLARSSTTFDSAVASSPWTLPSHRGLLWGVNPWDTRVQRETGTQDPQVRSLARLWREAGGIAYCLSQSEMLSRQSNLLIDYDDPFSSSSRAVQRFAARLSSILDLAMGLTGRKLSDVGLESSAQKKPNHAVPRLCHTLLSDSAAISSRALHTLRTSRLGLRQLDRLLASTTASKPKHVFVNLMDMHEPYLHAPSINGTILEPGSVPTTNLALHSSNFGESQLALEALHVAYRQAIRALDGSLSNLLGILRKHGVLDDAAVFVVSDHGQSLGENGFFGHGRILSDELVRIPAFLWRTRPDNKVDRKTWFREWLDHRHFYDIIADQFQAPEKPLGSSIQETHTRRGPAISYFKGSPLSGFNPAKRLPPYERIRAWKGDLQLEMLKNKDNLDGRLVSMQGTNPSVLEDIVSTVLSETKLEPSAEQFTDSSTLGFERLESWGYV